MERWLENGDVPPEMEGLARKCSNVSNDGYFSASLKILLTYLKGKIHLLIQIQNVILKINNYIKLLSLNFEIFFPLKQSP